MAIVEPTYVSSTQFTVEEDQTAFYPVGRKLHFLQSPDFPATAAVDSATYSAGTDLTTVTVDAAVITENVSQVQFTPDVPESQAEHTHTSSASGGVIPAADLSQEDVDDLVAFPTLFPTIILADAGKPLVVNAEGDGYDLGEITEGGGGTPTPDYRPPMFMVASDTEIILPAGDYYQMGYRHNGQYSLPSSEKWTITKTTKAVLQQRTGWGVSGYIGGLINNSVYGVFLVYNENAPTVPDVWLIPMLRSKQDYYSAPNTVIVPGDHATGTNNENGFLTSASQWTGFQLVKVKITEPATDGDAYTVVNNTNASPDTILISGDQTAKISDTDWFLVTPYAPAYLIPSLYIGTVTIDGSAHLTTGLSNGWETGAGPEM